LTLLFDMEGLPEFAKYVELAPKVATRAAKLAINQTTERKGLKLAREAMQAQVNFPRGYFNEIDSKTGYPRFGISYRATDTRLSAGIVAREAPTSLARFAVNRNVFTRTGRNKRGAGVKVQISPGRVNHLESAFFLQLNSGNIGVGIRLKNGQTLTNTVGAKIIRTGPLAGVALLYGPSVEQVFSTVAADIAPTLLSELSIEFLRQFDRLFRDANFAAT